jgi:glucosamine--fructose-6-phosphate aminotransferase (isomerizing)
VLSETEPDRLVAAKSATPIVLGLGDGENFVASDIPAMLEHTRRVVFLEDGEVAELTAERIALTTFDGTPIDRPPRVVSWDPVTAQKGGYKHFLLKEIHEQPQAIIDTMRGRVLQESGDVQLDADVAAFLDATPIERAILVACGTAWHACLVGKFLLERLAGIPCEVDYGSEFRARDPILQKGTALIVVSQSGETADTLAAVRIAQRSGARVLAVTNVQGSTLAREAEQVLLMRAGPEIGVAATKTYTSQLLALLHVALHLGRSRGTLSRSRFESMIREARRLPAQVDEVLQGAAAVEACALRYCRGYSFMYMGRRYNLSTAYEGALKMKEISYLHAEGYGAGEMKHGPLALVDERMVCVAVAPQGRVTEKMVSNIQEIRARKGKVIAVATRGDELLRSVADHLLEIPPCEEMFSPVLSVIPLQLLAYRTAVELGRDVDRPRNLAKSVTVE